MQVSGSGVLANDTGSFLGAQQHKPQMRGMNPALAGWLCLSVGASHVQHQCMRSHSGKGSCAQAGPILYRFKIFWWLEIQGV